MTRVSTSVHGFTNVEQAAGQAPGRCSGAALAVLHGRGRHTTMKTPQLFSGALILALGAAVACNRTETNEQARSAAGEVRTAAARAGETIADGWLTTKIQAQYFADEDIKARYINVSAHDRVVTLSGYVESDATRQQAVQIARNTDGVRDVTDKLLIGRAPSDEFPARAPEPAPVATGG